MRLLLPYRHCRKQQRPRAALSRLLQPSHLRPHHQRCSPLPHRHRCHGRLRRLRRGLPYRARAWRPTPRLSTCWPPPLPPAALQPLGSRRLRQFLPLRWRSLRAPRVPSHQASASARSSRRQRWQGWRLLLLPALAALPTRRHLRPLSQALQRTQSQAPQALTGWTVTRPGAATLTRAWRRCPLWTICWLNWSARPLLAAAVARPEAAAARAARVARACRKAALSQIARATDGETLTFSAI
jgi:hypothetical protein